MTKRQRDGETKWADHLTSSLRLLVSSPKKEPAGGLYEPNPPASGSSRPTRKPNSVFRAFIPRDSNPDGNHFSGPFVADTAQAAYPRIHRRFLRRAKRPWAGHFPHIWPCCRWGLPCRRSHPRRGALLPHHFTLTGNFFPAVSFLWHFPSDCSALTLSSTVPRAVRTFLIPTNRDAVATSAATLHYIIFGSGGLGSFLRFPGDQGGKEEIAANRIIRKPRLRIGLVKNWNTPGQRP